jgi:HPt (histidine-containing phosphotransfer) domain-containing protein
MNGLEATRLIRALPGPRARVRVIAVTAHAFAEQVEACRRAGMDAHVAKPFRLAVLLAAIAGGAEVARAEAPAVLDRAMFEDAAGAVSAAELDAGLATLAARCEAVLDGLRAAGASAPAGGLAEAAHRLAGSAGVFGFLALAEAARRFEAAAECDEATALAAPLAAAISDCVGCVREERAALASRAA